MPNRRTPTPHQGGRLSSGVRPGRQHRPQKSERCKLIGCAIEATAAYGNVVYWWQLGLPVIPISINSMGQYQQNAGVRRQAVAARINTDTLDDQVLISSA